MSRAWGTGPLNSIIDQIKSMIVDTEGNILFYCYQCEIEYNLGEILEHDHARRNIPHSQDG